MNHYSTRKVNYRNKQRNKTIKKKPSAPIINQHNVDYYNKNYYNTPGLPFTSIIKYINANYYSFNNLANTSDQDSINQFSFYFDVKPDFISNSKIVNIDQTIRKNPLMSVNKLLAYALYTKSKSFFVDQGNLKIELLKIQIGKDTIRTDIYMNGDLYKIQKSEPESETAAFEENTDYFILTLLDYLSKYGKNIDYNLINKIGITCCQNLFNLIVDQLTLTIMKAIKPEMCVFLNGKKYIELNLYEHSKTAKLYFKCDIVISYQEILDPEFQCGTLDFILCIDYIKNNYYFEKFILQYDVEKCNPGYIELQQQEANAANNSGKAKYLLPVAGVAAGVVAVPFLLGIVGGNEKKHRKTRKNIKHQKSYI